MSEQVRKSEDQVESSHWSEHHTNTGYWTGYHAENEYITETKYLTGQHSETGLYKNSDYRKVRLRSKFLQDRVIMSYLTLNNPYDANTLTTPRT